MLSSSTHTGYRKDIDGLRAVAVLLVILFHAGLSAFPSGFIGVDIFFVISGYLITGIILRQLREGKFTLNNFFIHRLWRIQPALIAMSVVVFVAATCLFLPVDYLTFLHSAKYNAMLIANQFFARQSAEYASPDSEIFPLLHTWSLSIEWQWYLIMPLAVSLTSWLISRWRFSEKLFRNDRNLILVWGISSAVLAFVAIVLAKQNPAEAYYSLFTRAFEFSTGGTAFIISRHINKVPRLVNAVSGLLALMILCFISLKSGVLSVYPNGYTLLVVTASTVILLGGHYNGGIVSKFLSLSPLAYIGRISYSLYLWHWPVFAFFRYLDYPLKNAGLVIALTLIILLALLSYYVIEKPLRRCRLSLLWTVTLLILPPVIFFNAAYSVANKHQGFPQRISQAYAHQQTVLKKYAQMADGRDACLNDDQQNPAKCQLGDKGATESALLIGDSNSNHFWGFFDALGKNTHVKITALSTPSCLALPGIFQYDWWIYKNQNYSACHKQVEMYYQLIRQNHYRYVIIGEIWSMYARGANLINHTGDQRSVKLSQERMNEAARTALDIIIASGAKPVFMKTVFPMPAGYQKCLRSQVVTGIIDQANRCFVPGKRMADDPFISALFNQLAKEYPILTIVDAQDIQCPDGLCRVQLDGMPVYRDVGHLTDYASYQFGKMYLAKYGNPLN